MRRGWLGCIAGSRWCRFRLSVFVVVRGCLRPGGWYVRAGFVGNRGVGIRRRPCTKSNRGGMSTNVQCLCGNLLPRLRCFGV